MRGALEHLYVQRVDHGIKLTEDPDLLAEFVRREMLITMCPISNVKLRCVKNILDLPIRLYLDNGIRFSINSDDPAYFGAYILDNYCGVQDAFNLTEDDWARIVRASIEGSFYTLRLGRVLNKPLATSTSDSTLPDCKGICQSLATPRRSDNAYGCINYSVHLAAFSD